ncbi:hypothetical protein D9613_008976 [Agrocybe pediades]|uniref:HMG box domain-containing protein n=1 Tax=Agrocybe pediades TaxID=84607 RepID=A0A8H4R334_9AGAR|nr:hypothetical protein D9613_008976 [Agrocybe pediades]
MSSRNNFDFHAQGGNYVKDFDDIFTGVYHETHLNGGPASFPIQTGGAEEHTVQMTMPYGLSSSVPSPARPDNHAFNHIFPSHPTTRPSLPSFPFPAVYADAESTRGTRSRRRRDPEHIPRPRNAFIFFRSYFIDHLLPSGSGQQHEISKQAGEAWRRLSKSEREPFVHRAKLEREMHKARYPDYVYAGGRGTRRGASNSVAASPTPSFHYSESLESASGFSSRLLDLAPHSSSHFSETQLQIPENNGFSENFIPEEDLTFLTALSSGSESWLHNFDSYGCEGTIGLATPSDKVMNPFDFLTEGMPPSTGSSPSHSVSSSFDSVVEGTWENQDFSFDINQLDLSDF